MAGHRCEFCGEATDHRDVDGSLSPCPESIGATMAVGALLADDDRSLVDAKAWRAE